MTGRIRRLSASAALALVLMAVPGDADPVAVMPIERLKQAYLDCERAAQAAWLGSGSVTTCATIYEALKSQGFSGDFKALRDWYLDACVEDKPIS